MQDVWYNLDADLRAQLVLTDSSGNPVTTYTYADVNAGTVQIRYRRSDQSAWTQMTSVVAGTLGAYVANSFAPDRNGLYAVGLPSGARAATARWVLIEASGTGIKTVRVKIPLRPIDPQAAKVPATLAANDVSGNLPADILAQGGNAIGQPGGPFSPVVAASVLDADAAAAATALAATGTFPANAWLLFTDGAEAGNAYYVATGGTGSLTLLSGLLVGAATNDPFVVLAPAVPVIPSSAGTPSVPAVRKDKSDPAKAGDAMALTSGERTTLAGVIWNSLLSGMTTVGSVGKKLAGWALGTDNKAVLSSDAHTGAVIPTVTSVTNAVTVGTINANVITATSVAASALNGKGDWLASTSYTAPPTVTAIRQEMDANSTKLAHLDADVSSRSTFDPASTNVTVGGYATGKDPASYLLVTPANKLATNASGYVTATNGGGGGSGTTENLTVEITSTSAS